MRQHAKRKTKKGLIAKVGIGLVMLIYFIMLVFLHYNQALVPYDANPFVSEQSVKYISDLPSHINAGHGDQAIYSILYVILSFLYDLPCGELWVSLLLSLFTIGAIYLSYRLFLKLMPDTDRTVLFITAMVGNMVFPLFIPSLNQYMYMGMQPSVAYHNSTYIGMKFAGLLVLSLFFDLKDKYVEHITFKEWLKFAAALIFATAIKPNFLVGFVPAMLIFMIIDFIRVRGKGFINFIIFGTTMLPSLAVILFQLSATFGDASHLTFTFADILRIYSDNPIASVICSIAFPLCVLVFNLKDLIKDRVFGFTWLMWLMNFLVFIFLSESGPRRYHGNMAWGYFFAVGAVFLVCLYKWLCTIKNCHLSGIARLTYFASSFILISYHVICWIWYFGRVFLGMDYRC